MVFAKKTIQAEYCKIDFVKYDKTWRTVETCEKPLGVGLWFHFWMTTQRKAAPWFSNLKRHFFYWNDGYGFIWNSD